MLRYVSLAAFAAILLAAPALAQNIVIQPRAGSAAEAKGDIRVNVAMSFFVAAPTDDSEPAVKAQEQARRVIYESAARECDVLRGTIAGECRLESININVNRQYGNQVPQGFNASGNFTYHVKLK
ncbi:MAG TPA: hypothetical protein VN655_00110 [Pseudolabrys sp.]|jgi:hypothetical protein|nr:hypothetical protein [Pseudolabrys sp.]